MSTTKKKSIDQIKKQLLKDLQDAQKTQKNQNQSHIASQIQSKSDSNKSSKETKSQWKPMTNTSSTQGMTQGTTQIKKDLEKDFKPYFPHKEPSKISQLPLKSNNSSAHSSEVPKGFTSSEDSKSSDSTIKHSNENTRSSNESKDSSHDESSSSKELFSINAFTSFLAKRGYKPLTLFFDEEDSYKFVEVIHKEQIFLIYITSSYPMDYSKSVHYPQYEMVYNETPDEEQNSGSPSDIYKKIDLEDGGEKHRPLKLKLVDPRDIYKVYSTLNRMKVCTENIDYKLAYVCSSFLCYINRKNEVECYNFVNGPKILGQKIVICVDIENFYNNIKEIPEMINKFYNCFFANMTKAHVDMIDNLTKKIDTYQADKKNLFTYYKRIEADSNRLARASKVIDTLKMEELSLLTKNVKIASDEVTNAFLAEQKAKDLSRVQLLLTESTKVYTELAEKYKKELFDFDMVIYSNTELFNQINQNFSLLRNIK